MSRSRLIIDTAALRHNVAVWRSLLAPGCRLCGVVKAEGYGLGATGLAKTLRSAGVQVLAVYSPAQAHRLIEEGDTGELLILAPHIEPRGGLDDPVLQEAYKRLMISVDALPVIDELASLKLPLRLHLHVDSGMSRSGLDAAEVSEAVQRIAGTAMKLEGVWTHMADAATDASSVESQHARFARATAELPPGLLRHSAATHTALRSERYHLDMVRVGLGLLGYGYSDLKGRPKLGEARNLRPSVRWLAPLVHVRKYPKDAQVGYNGTHTLKRDSVLGVVPVGYGDGYPLALSKRSSVTVRGREAMVLGRVSMDQIVIDLTDVPRAAVGDDVVLYDNDPSSPCYLPTLASAAKSHVYEMLCRLGPRVLRDWDNQP